MVTKELLKNSLEKCDKPAVALYVSNSEAPVVAFADGFSVSYASAVKIGDGLGRVCVLSSSELLECSDISEKEISSQNVKSIGAYVGKIYCDDFVNSIGLKKS